MNLPEVVVHRDRDRSCRVGAAFSKEVIEVDALGVDAFRQRFDREFVDRDDAHVDLVDGGAVPAVEHGALRYAQFVVRNLGVGDVGFGAWDYWGELRGVDAREISRERHIILAGLDHDRAGDAGGILNLGAVEHAAVDQDDLVPHYARIHEAVAAGGIRGGGLGAEARAHADHRGVVFGV
jgi:hypothetical protein